MEKNEGEGVNRAQVLRSFFDMKIVTEIPLEEMVQNREEQLLECVFGDTEVYKKHDPLFKKFAEDPIFWRNYDGLPTYHHGHYEMVFESGSHLELRNVVADYDQSDILFCLNYLVRIKTSYFDRSGRHSEDLFPVVKYVDVPKWFYKRVPLKIISCWMEGKLERKSLGISIESTSYNQLRYQGYPEAYPVGLYRWIASWKGEDGFLRVLLTNSMVSPESYRILRKKLNEIAALTSCQGYGPSAHSDKAALEIDGDDSEGVDADSVIDALSLSEKETERLNAVRKLEGRPLTYSKWAKYLGFKSKGSTFSFIQKEEQKGLLTIEQHSDSGVALRLTNKAQAALQSL